MGTDNRRKTEEMEEEIRIEEKIAKELRRDGIKHFAGDRYAHACEVGVELS